MAFTALNLISISFYISQIFAKGFDNGIPAEDANTGLQALNDVLSEKSVDGSLNPYYSSLEFNSVAGQETYFIENMVEMDTLTFLLDTQRFSIQIVGRDAYNGCMRSENVTSLPWLGYAERLMGGANISLYYLPDRVYPMTVWGKFALTGAANLFTDLSLLYDGFYIAYLKCAVANRLCMYYGADAPASLVKALATYDVTMSNQISPPDLTMKKISTLNNNLAVNWAVVNLANTGWLP